MKYSVSLANMLRFDPMIQQDVFLSLGSNKGDRKQMLQDALKHLRVDAGPVSKLSNVYETAPWGNAGQPLFLNQVICLNTLLPPQELMKVLLEIEKKMGRQRGPERWQQRPIDIDILFYGQAIFSEKHLTVPHPELQNRRFVLEPLAEIAPAFIHPVLRRTVSELLSDCKDALAVHIWGTRKFS